jgi:hypothetical protein
MLVGLFMSVSMAAESDPFVGTWAYNAQKSPKPTITYGIKDLGGDRYALTGSTGETTEIKADGVSIKSPSGATVSFKKLDDHTWQMDRIESRTMVRTYLIQMEAQSKGKPDDNREYKVSDDGKALTIVTKSLMTSAVFTSVWDKQ